MLHKCLIRHTLQKCLIRHTLQIRYIHGLRSGDNLLALVSHRIHGVEDLFALTLVVSHVIRTVLVHAG